MNKKTHSIFLFYIILKKRLHKKLTNTPRKFNATLSDNEDALMVVRVGNNF